MGRYSVYLVGGTLLGLLCTVVWPGSLLAADAADYDQRDIAYCMLDALSKASDEITVGSLRRECRERFGAEGGGESALARRIEEERVTQESQFVITPHNPNYILLAAYNSSGVNRAPFSDFPNYADSLKDTEVKFQISFKYPLATNLFGSGGNLYAAYTNRSFWQLYNGQSAPFRETNHEPELFMAFKPDWRFGGFNTSVVGFGVNHQSNGQAGSLSRSWNRLFAQIVVDKQNAFTRNDNLAFSLKPWYRIKEDREDDDNPDIEDYMGNFEFMTIYKLDDNLLSLTARNNLQSHGNRGALQMGWSFPLVGRLRGYVQWFNGYGESLIDYDANVNSIGFGIKLTDWL